jgi:hypothetical protein
MVVLRDEKRLGYDHHHGGVGAEDPKIFIYMSGCVSCGAQLHTTLHVLRRMHPLLLEAPPPSPSSAQSRSVLLINHLNSNSSRLPQWLMDYFAWHRATMQELNETNWDTYQYVLLRCVIGEEYCFGTSDRLKMIPVMLLMAVETNRLFLIHWSRPASFEEFLIPNHINWTVPSWLKPKIDVEAALPVWRLVVDGPFGPENTERVIRMRNMVHTSGIYDEHRVNVTTELSMWDVYHDIWNAMFQPSPAVLERIENSLRDLDLLLYDKMGQIVNIKPYVSVHIRANHFEDLSSLHEEENAIRCAATLQEELALSLLTREDAFVKQFNANTTTEAWRNNLPIYVASDLIPVTRNAIAYGEQHQLKVVGRYTEVNATNPLHMDEDVYDEHQIL